MNLKLVYNDNALVWGAHFGGRNNEEHRRAYQDRLDDVVNHADLSTFPVHHISNKKAVNWAGWYWQEQDGPGWAIVPFMEPEVNEWGEVAP